MFLVKLNKDREIGNKIQKAGQCIFISDYLLTDYLNNKKAVMVDYFGGGTQYHLSWKSPKEIFSMIDKQIKIHDKQIKNLKKRRMIIKDFLIKNKVGEDGFIYKDKTKIKK